MSSIAFAQDYIDLIKTDYAITPMNTFDTTEATTMLQEVNVDLIIPIELNDSFAILTGITYEMINASFVPNRKEESVIGLTLKLGANLKHNSKWSGTYLFLPKISSDLKKISNRDFQFGGAILMKYNKTNHFSYKFGVYGNNELFGPLIVPLFGFYYISPSEKIEANVTLPITVDLNYSIAKSTRFGINFKGQVKSYQINTVVATEGNRYLARTSNDLYTYLQYGMKNGLNFQLGFGRSIGRLYSFYTEKIALRLPPFNFGDNRSQLNSGFSDSWLFKLAIFYRLKL